METRVENFDDIVFENRNKEYGAYELRKRYPKRGTIALAVSLFVLLVAVGVPLIASILKQKNYNKYLENKAVAEMENIKVNRDEIKPPPPPPPPPEIKQVQFRAPVIVDTLSNPEVELGTTDDLSKIANTAMVDTVQQTIEIVDDADPVIETPMEIYAIQEKPAFPGGEAALLAYISKEIKYPVMAQENGVEGTVYIRFVVTKSGDVGEVQLMSSADPLLDNEAMRVIRTLPRWSPGKYNGNAVNVWFVVPIKFALQN